MNIRDLKYIVELAKEKNFAQASKKMFVSQPALSMQIKKLEQYLGVDIFERDKKNFLITPIGEEIIKRAKIIIDESEQIKQLAKTNNDPFSGSIYIGAFPTLASYFFPEFIKKINKKFPKLKIYLIEAKSLELIEKLKSGKIDCAMLAMPINDEAIIGKKIFSEDFMLATPLNHPLSKKNKIDLKDLKNQPLMLLEDGHCLRDQALEICSMVKAYEYTDFQATSLETLRQMVASGTGITLIPQIAVQKNNKIKYLNIVNAPSREIGLFYRKTSIKNLLIQEIYKLAI